MTQRMQIVISDNLDYHELDGRHTDADETLTISLDGEIRRLDLTAEHALELRSFMKRYLEAGDDPGAAPAPPQEMPQAGKISANAVTAGVSGWRVHAAMRTWADRNMPGTYTRRGDGRTGYAYDPALPAAYHGHLRDTGHPWQYHRVFTALERGGKS